MAVSPRITGQRPAVRLDGTGPTTGQRPAVAAPAAEFDEDVSLRLAMEFMGRRQWADAKQAFLQLASKVPTNKRYRAMLAVARGRGYQDENRHDDARAEFRRATELDPSLDAARAALEQLGEPEKKSGGLFGRLLKK
jgi:Tfp pilus assembly protein PilF